MDLPYARLSKRLGKQLPKLDLPAPKEKTRILILIDRACTLRLNVSIAFALRLRGYDPQLIYCDGVFKICEQVSNLCPSAPCGSCLSRTEQVLQNAGLPYYPLSHFFKPSDNEIISDWLKKKTFDQLRHIGFWHGYNLEEMISRTLIRRFSHEEPWLFPNFPSRLRIATEQSMQSILAFERILEELNISRVYMFAGLVSTSYPLFVIARMRGLDCAITEYNYHASQIILKINDAPQLLNLKDEWAARRNIPLSETERKELYRYLDQRRNPKAPVFLDYQRSKESGMDDLKQQLRIPDRARIALLISNLTFDTSLRRDRSFFSTMNEWLVYSVRRFTALYPNDILIIRTHPGESLIAPLQVSKRIGDMLIEAFGYSLPSNVRLIDSDNKTNTFSLGQLAQIYISFMSSALNAELACNGKAQIVAGPAHVRGRGFTIDPETKEEYDHLLNRLFDLPPMSSEQKNLAERYARLSLMDYGFKLPFSLAPDDLLRHEIREKLFNLDQLMPNHSDVFDYFCDVIAGKHPDNRFSGNLATN